MATLNLPSTISGICVPAAAPAVQPDASALAPADAAGLAAPWVQAPSASVPAMSNVSVRPVRPIIRSSSSTRRGHAARTLRLALRRSW